MKALIVEGRYDSLVTKLSNTLLGIVKDSYSCVESEDGMFAGKKTFFAKGDSVPHIEEHPEIYFEEIEAPNVQLEFYLTLKIPHLRGKRGMRIRWRRWVILHRHLVHHQSRLYQSTNFRQRRQFI